MTDDTVARVEAPRSFTQLAYREASSRGISG